MENIKTLTLKDIIAKKQEKQEKKKETKYLYVKSLDGNIKVMKPEKKLCYDAVAMDKNGDNYLVYESVIEPPLKSSELQEAYGVFGIDIVDEVFELGEIAAIAKEIVNMVGLNDSVKVVEELKN